MQDDPPEDVLRIDFRRTEEACEWADAAMVKRHAPALYRAVKTF
jgi:hypothetical protein